MEEGKENMQKLNPHTGNPLNPNSRTVRDLERSGHVLQEFNNRPSYTGLNRFRMERKLGKGAYGDVYHVIDKDTGNEYAMKKILIKENDVNIEDIKLEINILQNQKSDCAIKLIEAFQENDYFYIITSYFNGYTLEKYENEMPETRTLANFKIFENMYTNLLHCIDSLHAERIYHKDIKPNNIVLHNGEPRIIDFGLSVNMKLNPNKICVPTGTTSYVSRYMTYLKPDTETVICEKAFIFHDYWDLILTFYFLITGKHFFGELGMAAMLAPKKDFFKEYSGKLNLIKDYKNEQMVKMINKILETLSETNIISGGSFISKVDLREEDIPDIRKMMNFKEY